MRAGVLAVVDGTFKMVDSFTETVTEDDQELARRLEIDRVFSLPDGSMAFAGRAAAERLANQRDAAIEDDEIRVTEGTEVVTDYTEFVGVTGEFVVVSSGDGEFAFDLIGAETNTNLERATLDLDGFFASHGSATPWRAGFSGNGDAGMNGVFHGADLRASHDLDSLLADSRLNQLGLSYGHDGDEVKMTASRSGYVEVYQPSSYDAAAFLTYLREEMLDHVV
ncbi:hypothetical protein HALDL1_04075 [Halobacterium sp. DL1]|jgi:hypothetical protein|nr:hypothetical protein HALDL1_04075 [Halobacterium sp. DL1]